RALSAYGSVFHWLPPNSPAVNDSDPMTRLPLVCAIDAARRVQLSRPLTYQNSVIGISAGAACDQPSDRACLSGSPGTVHAFSAEVVALQPLAAQRRWVIRHSIGGVADAQNRPLALGHVPRELSV